MTISSTDFIFTFSGGSTNTNPDASLGGNPSNQPILGTRLFDDVTPAETTSGFTDFRCIYLNNENNTQTLYSANLSVSYTVPGDVTVQLGFNFQNEIQNVTITNATFITGGSMTLTYTDYTGNNNIVIPWNSVLSSWATTFQTALQTIMNLENVTVSGSYAGTSVVFEIDFLGAAANRSHDLITVQSNSLTSSQPTGISIVKILNGGPINQIADMIDVSTTIPVGIVFNSSVATIGDIRPLDFVPIWIMRSVPVNSSAIQNDGFTLQVSGGGIP